MKRGTAWISSRPTSASNIPIQPAIHPFRGISPDAIDPDTMMPMTASQNISHERKFSAKLKISGINTISRTIPSVPPMKEAVIDMPSAWPPSPRWAS